MTSRMPGCTVNYVSQTQGEVGQKELIKAILNYKDSVENRSEIRCIYITENLTTNFVK